MYCGKCGREISDNALFCNYCGAETGESGVGTADRGDTPQPETNYEYRRKDVRARRYTARAWTISVMLLIIFALYTFFSNRTERKISSKPYMSSYSSETSGTSGNNDEKLFSGMAIKKPDNSAVRIDFMFIVTDDKFKIVTWRSDGQEQPINTLPSILNSVFGE